MAIGFKTFSRCCFSKFILLLCLGSRAGVILYPPTPSGVSRRVRCSSTPPAVLPMGPWELPPDYPRITPGITTGITPGLFPPPPWSPSDPLLAPLWPPPAPMCTPRAPPRGPWDLCGDPWDHKAPPHDPRGSQKLSLMAPWDPPCCENQQNSTYFQ